MPGIAHIEKQFSIYKRMVKPSNSLIKSVAWIVLWPLPEWPDDKLKSSTNFSKSCPKSSHSSLTLKILLFT